LCWKALARVPAGSDAELDDAAHGLSGSGLDQKKCRRMMLR
jgi:hypothetical protein